MVIPEVYLANDDLGWRCALRSWDIAAAHSEVSIHYSRELFFDGCPRFPDKLVFIEGQLGSAELLCHQAVYVARVTFLRLLPHVQQELPGLSRIAGHNLELQEMHHPHQQGRAILSTPQLQLCLLFLQLTPELLHGSISFGAPNVQIQVKGPQPCAQLGCRTERVFRLPFLHRTPFEQVPLNLRPLQPHPSMNVLQLRGLSVLGGMLKLKGVEVHSRKTIAQDVHRVKVVHSQKTWVALGLLKLHSVVHEVSIQNLQWALVVRIVRRSRGAWSNPQGGLC
mmetsp:Transcript_30048/g.70023  ORF Transcript_30048/g.70023 Transcript_30048/m.70023 type:complete len:280 (+) Transcript_30048:862-1701(+)